MLIQQQLTRLVLTPPRASLLLCPAAHLATPVNNARVLQKREHELKGRRLDAKAAVPKAHLGTAKLTRKMFVGGTGELTDQDFVEHFSQFGEIEDAAVSS